ETAEAAWHDDVGEEEPWPLAVVETVQRFYRAMNDRRLETQLLQQSRSELGDRFVVLNDEHPSERPSVPERVAVLLPGPDVMRGQVDREGRALAKLGFDRHRTAQLFGEAEHLAQSQAGPLAEALGREERLEHSFHRLRRHPAAAIRNAQRDMLAAQAVRVARQNFVRRAEPQLAAMLHRVAGVEREVEERELERSGVGVHAPELVGHFDDDLDIGPQRRAEQGADVAEEVLEVDVLEFERLGASECEQLLRQARAAQRRVANSIEHSLDLDRVL